MVSVEDYEEQLAKAGEFHGEICGGIAIGTKLAMYGMELMGFELNKRHKNLIVFLEIDRCMADAVQAVTRCTMGKRTLKQMYYGKFAATFYNMDTGEAIRVSVHVDLNPSQMPGKPHTSVFCSVCGEKITDGRHLNRGGKPVCMPCAEGAYYEIIDE